MLLDSGKGEVINIRRLPNVLITVNFINNILNINTLLTNSLYETDLADFSSQIHAATFDVTYGKHPINTVA